MFEVQKDDIICRLLHFKNYFFEVEQKLQIQMYYAVNENIINGNHCGLVRFSQEDHWFNKHKGGFHTCQILLVKKPTKAKIFCSLIVSRRNDGSLNFTEELKKYVAINNWDRLHRPFFSAIDLGRKGQNAKVWAVHGGSQ